MQLYLADILNITLFCKGSALTSPTSLNRPPKKPAGQVQSDYFIKRDDKEDTALRGPKKPVGQLQSDYYQSRQTGPRSEVDESPININMGTNPKKQSKSFKVLQWMTETEREEPEGKSQPETSSPDVICAGNLMF